MIQTCYKTFVSKQKTSLSSEDFDVYAYKASDGSYYLSYERNSSGYLFDAPCKDPVFIEPEIQFSKFAVLPVQSEII